MWAGGACIVSRVTQHQIAYCIMQDSSASMQPKSLVRQMTRNAMNFEVVNQIGNKDSQDDSQNTQIYTDPTEPIVDDAVTGVVVTVVEGMDEAAPEDAAEEKEGVKAKSLLNFANALLARCKKAEDVLKIEARKPVPFPKHACRIPWFGPIGVTNFDAHMIITVCGLIIGEDFHKKIATREEAMEIVRDVFRRMGIETDEEIEDWLVQVIDELDSCNITNWRNRKTHALLNVVWGPVFKRMYFLLTEKDQETGAYTKKYWPNDEQMQEFLGDLTDQKPIPKGSKKRKATVGADGGDDGDLLTEDMMQEDMTEDEKKAANAARKAARKAAKKAEKKAEKEAAAKVVLTEEEIKLAKKQRAQKGADTKAAKQKILAQEEQIAKMDKNLAASQAKILAQEEQIAKMDKNLAASQVEVARLTSELAAVRASDAEDADELANTHELLVQVNKQLSESTKQLTESKKRRSELSAKTKAHNKRQKIEAATKAARDAKDRSEDDEDSSSDSDK